MPLGMLAGACLLLLVFLAVPARALAWCNGPYNGNGYGSHDWILDEARRLAGPGGKWVVRKTALLSSDTPDTSKWAAATQHYFETGSCRGGPQTVSDLYHKAIVAYKAGNKDKASIYLGQLSHCFADIGQPFHTTSAANDHKALHKQYEWAVDDYQNVYGLNRSWLTPNTAQDVVDVRERSISVALFARDRYASLVKSYSATHSVRSGTSGRITKELMSRIVSDLADMIRGIAAGTGEAAMPQPITEVHLTQYSPRQGQSVGAFVSCVDADGNPLPGVGVKFVWHLASGKKTIQAYSQDDGQAHFYQPIGSPPAGVPESVDAVVTVAGVTQNATAWFTPRK